MVYGKAQLRSPWFSGNWRLLGDSGELARMHRMGRIYTTAVTMDKGGQWLLEPHGSGVVRAIDSEGNEFARIVRTSWLGRRWDLLSPAWNFELISNPRPRSWRIAIGGATAAEMRGSLASYNRVDVNALIGVPLAAVMLGWHVIARPWEAIAEPSGLLPQQAARSAELRTGQHTPNPDFFRKT